MCHLQILNQGCAPRGSWLERFELHGLHGLQALNFMLELRESADTHQLWCGLKFLESLLGRSET